MKTLKVLTGVCLVIMFLSAIAYLIFCALKMGTAAVISIGLFSVFLFLAGRQSGYW